MMETASSSNGANELKEYEVGFFEKKKTFFPQKNSQKSWIKNKWSVVLKQCLQFLPF